MKNQRRLVAGSMLVLIGAAGLFLLRESLAPPREAQAPPGTTSTAGARSGTRAEEEGPSAPPAPAVPNVGVGTTSATGHGGLIRVRDPKAHAEANARSIVEAAQTGRHPERLNPLVAPRPFDKASFEQDPLAYFDVVEPGRVFQTAESGPGVKTLEAEGPAHLETAPKGSVRLSVMGEPRSPVTFTSFDRGAFENDLTSITVLSDAAGEASVRFTATAGTIDDVNILSASPLSAGQVAFLVTVKRDL